MFVSLLGLTTLYFRHSTKTRWLNEDLPNEMFRSTRILNLENEEFNQAKFKRRTWFRPSFWGEALIFLICPLPYYDDVIKVSFMNNGDKTKNVTCYYLVSDFILIFMFLRIFFLIRAVFNYNIFTDVYAKKLCKSYGFTAGQRFTFKSILKTQPELTVTVMTFGSISLLAYLIRVTELPYYEAIGQKDFAKYF